MAWTILSNRQHTEIDLLARELNITPICAAVLVNRGITSLADAASFLRPTLQQIEEPSLLPDMDRAVLRIGEAIRSKEIITIFGDYDTDGTTSTSLLLRFFREIGVDHVNYYIPHREKEGYGLNLAAIDEIALRHTTLMITLDTGTTAHEAIDFAKRKNIDTVVIDHHETTEQLPNAVAIVNPKRKDAKSSCPYLAAVGVTFKLIISLRRQLQLEALIPKGFPNLKQFLDLVAIGTIGDIVPLIGDNRVFCRFGIEALRQTTNPGLAALMQVAELDPMDLSSEDIAFRLSPRINAAGRMDHALHAVELMTASDAQSALLLAEYLNGLNQKRRTIEKKMIDEAVEIVNKAPLGSSIVLSSTQWPTGILGIVAGKLAEKFRRPTILISFQEKIGRGSARSVGQFPLLEGISAQAPLLKAFGGHQAAAGITIEPLHVEQFKRQFDAFAQCHLREQDIEKHMTIDCEVSPGEITPKVIGDFKLLAPFGQGNPEPVLCMRNLDIRDRRIVGNNHLKLKINGQFITLDAIGFGMAEHPASHGTDPISACFIPRLNTWNGTTTIQLNLKDIDSEKM